MLIIRDLFDGLCLEIQVGAETVEGAELQALELANYL